MANIGTTPFWIILACSFRPSLPCRQSESPPRRGDELSTLSTCHLQRPGSSLIQLIAQFSRHSPRPFCVERSFSSRRGKPCFPGIIIEAVNHLFYLFIRWYIMRVYVQVSDRSSRNSGTMLQASDNMPIICLERLRWWNWRRWELHKPKAQLRFRFTLQVWMV